MIYPDFPACYARNFSPFSVANLPRIYYCFSARTRMRVSAYIMSMPASSVTLA